MTDQVSLHLTIRGTVRGDIQEFYSETAEIPGQQTEIQQLNERNQDVTLTYLQPSDTAYTRFDFGSIDGTFTISRMWYEYRGETQDVDLSVFLKENALEMHDISDAALTEDGLVVKVKAEDPYIVTEMGPTELSDAAASYVKRSNVIKNIIYTLIVDLACLVIFTQRKRFSTLPVELLENRKLILQMAKNDFKTKFAGSVLGVIWAFVQPCVTVLVYWFVFGHLGSGDVTADTGLSYPFVLWLIAGLVPWFFFQDTLTGGTNALLEYSYLVKKVVFKISVLPIVKELSAFFVHIFFIALMFVLYIADGHFPDIYWLQVIYYTFALFLYALACCFITCSIVVFFRDLSQLISIVIQIQVWMTPIMWNVDQFGSKLPGWVMSILKLNPLYYIVTGYRDAMMDKVWFWEKFDLTFYFWIITAVVFGLGAITFKRLKPHFADIL